MWFDDRPGIEPANVYIHGLAASSEAFDEVIANDPLSRYRTVRPDLLGFGASDKPTDFGYTIENHSAAVIELLGSLKPTDFNVIGHSLGGAIAVLIAEALPDRVRKIVLAEANLDPGGGGMSLPVARQSEDEYVSHGFERDLSSTEEVKLEMMEKASSVAIHRTSRSLVANTQPTIRERLLKLQIPRTFVVGAFSVAAPPLPSGESGEDLEEHGVRRIVIPDAGHSMMFDNPTGFAAAVAEALGLL